MARVLDREHGRVPRLARRHGALCRVPALRRAFPGASAGDLSWVLDLYTVIYAALLVPAGGTADLRGRKRTFLAGLGLFLAASAACGLAPSVGVLVAARAAQAIGAALLLPASLSLVLAAFPAERRAIAVSLWGAVSGLAAAVGPSVGSFLVDRLGWPSAFFLDLPFGAIALVRGARSLSESRNERTGSRLDVVGVGLLVTGVGAIAYGLVRGLNRDAIAPVVVGLGAFATFAQWARRAAALAIDLSLFRDRTYRWINAATLVYGIAFAMMFFSRIAMRDLRERACRGDVLEAGLELARPAPDIAERICPPQSRARSRTASSPTCRRAGSRSCRRRSATRSRSSARC